MIAFPVIVAVLVTWIQGGFSWVADRLSGGPAIRVEVQKPARQASADPKAQERAEASGVQVLQNFPLCPWTVWTVLRSPEALGEPPATEIGAEPEEWKRNRYTGDANYTRVVLMVSPSEGKTVRIEKVSLRILRRAPAPRTGEASVVALNNGQCGGEPETVTAHAVLDGDLPLVPVVPDKNSKEKFPQVVGEGGLDIDIIAATAECDCTWVPEITWSMDGETRTTQYFHHGIPYRTIPAKKYHRFAWKLKGKGAAGLYGWRPVRFDESLLELDPDLLRVRGQ
ncbi:hypothetical protein AB0O34_36585 [Sphaerisporangium sp. NPDC088356]|uniref:hypothetical protein n=1 Tax=Sphaerisporangium sp. NPDC088356 TaxID=3154871 RepID=UPI00342ED223